MLDTDTKRRIDTARDILVGKVPENPGIPALFRDIVKNAYPAEIQGGPLHDPKCLRMRA